MFNALQFVEIDKDTFESECISIMDTTSGGITRKELLEMPFDEYSLIRQKVSDTIERIKDSFKENGRSGSD